MTLVQRIQAFNHWIDNMLLALAPVLMKMGFVAGAVDILMSGWFSEQEWFQVGWAFTQAISVDAIFFVVLNAFWRTKDKRQKWWFAGLIALYGVTAFFIVNVTAFEQLRTVNSTDAMRSLGIAPEVFTYVRSALVIVSAVLFYLVENMVGVQPDVQTVQPSVHPVRTKRTTSVQGIPPAPVSVTPIEPLQLPQSTQSNEEAQAFAIIDRNPTIGPSQLMRELGWSGEPMRVRASRLRKKYNERNIQKPPAGS